MAPRVSPTIELGLGDSYFAQVVADAPTRYEWRSELLYDADTAQYGIKNRGVSAYGTASLHPLLMYRTAGVAVTDRDQAVAGYIPEGGPGVRFRSAQTEYATITQPTTPATLTIEWVGMVHTNPSADVAIAGMAVSGFSNYKGLGIWITTTGAIKGYGYTASLTTLDGGTITLDTLTHIVLTRSALTGTVTLKLYVNGALVDTDTGDVTATQAAIIAADDETPSATLNSTYCHLGFYDSLLTLTQVEDHYAALQWTDVTADTIAAVPLTIERGFRSPDFTRRVADIGVCTFGLNNGPTNSGGVAGYYSPGHASVRSGFRVGAPVRVSVGAVVVFRGRLSTIAPEPGRYQSKRTLVAAVDLLSTAARSRLTGAPLLEDASSDRVFEQIIGALTLAIPTEVIANTGSDTYATALDNSEDEAMTALDELARLAASECGWVFVRRTGAVEFQGRTERVLSYGTSSLTVNDTMVALGAAEMTDARVNQIAITTHPRDVDTVDTTVLATLDHAIYLGPLESRTVIVPYRNALVSTTTGRVGGMDMRTPVSTTDYGMFAGSDGSGADLTANLGVTASYGPNSVEWTVVNNSSTLPGYVTLLQARGRGVYDLQPVVSLVQEDDAIQRYGVSSLAIDLPYQDSPDVGASLASYLLAQMQTLGATATSVTLLLNDTTWTIATVLALDVSDRITVTETQTGISADYYIHGVRLDVTNSGGRADLTWTLLPADTGSFWILGVSGSSELGVTTRLFV